MTYTIQKHRPGPEMNPGTSGSIEMLQRNLRIFSISALICLIAAVALLSIRLILPAGCLIVFSASFGIAVFRKTSVLIALLSKALDDTAVQNEKKDIIMSDFSHTIREPLNNLVSLGDFFRTPSQAALQKDFYDTFLASTSSMVTAVNQLTMQSAGNMRYVKREPIRFNLLSSVLNTIEIYGLKEKAKLGFMVKNKGFSDFECLGDPVIIKQILIDIFTSLENSLTENAAMVVLGLSKLSDHDGEAIFKISIQTDRKFTFIEEKEFEEDRAAILITTSRGSFHVEKTENHSVINIIMPYLNPEPKSGHRADEGEPSAPGTVRTPRDLKEIRVLLVEDNPLNQKITNLTLKPVVKSVDTASDGIEAISMFSTEKYDLVLMDIQMPGMNGMQAAEKIRALESDTGKKVPIIAITANAMLGDREKCISSGIDDYISKPYHPSALIEVIRKNI